MSLVLHPIDYPVLCKHGLRDTIQYEQNTNQAIRIVFLRIAHGRMRQYLPKLANLKIASWQTSQAVLYSTYETRKSNQARHQTQQAQPDASFRQKYFCNSAYPD